MRTQEIYTDYHDIMNTSATPRLKGSVNREKRLFGMTG